jgi:hypothetical protein
MKIKPAVDGRAEGIRQPLRGRSVAFNICLAAASATARLLAAVVIDELDAPMVRANVGDGRPLYSAQATPIATFRPP